MSDRSQGYTTQPNAQELGLQNEGNNPALTQFITWLEGGRYRAHLPLQLALFISPLAALLSLDLTKSLGLNLEELLLVRLLLVPKSRLIQFSLQNMKVFGNQRPPLLQQMENDVWLAILQILFARLTALQAFVNLVTRWKEQDLVNKLTDEVRYFFRRGALGFVLSGHPV